MTEPVKVVFDCNVLLQALISFNGPSGRLLKAVIDQQLQLFISTFVLSTFVLDELRDVALRPKVQRKYKLSLELVEQFCADLTSFAILVGEIPTIFDFPRDPDDAHYINLTIAAQAKLVVSRDKDLLSLRDLSTEEGRDFVRRFPTLQILTPPEAIAQLESTGNE